MGAQAPGRWRRITRTLLRGIRTGLLLLIFFLVGFFIYLNEVGLPGFLKAPLIEKLRARGVDLEFAHARLHWNRGLVAEDVRVGRARPNAAAPEFTVKEVELRLNHAALAKFHLNVDALLLQGGRLVWQLEESNQPPITLSITNIQTQVRFLPGDQWELDHLVAGCAGANMQLSGSLTNASAVRDWKIFRGKRGGQPELTRKRLRELAEMIQRIKFAGAPELEVTVQGDARDAESFNGVLTLKAPGAETPWGTLSNGTLVARLAAPGTNRERQAEFELRADAADSAWGDTKNFHLSINATRDEDATNRVHARLEASAAQFTTQWAEAANAHLTADWVHSMTNAIPLSGTGELRLTDIHTRWGNAAELRLEGRFSMPPAKGLPQATEQWAWWAGLEPYFLDWNCQLKKIHAEDKAQKFDLEQLACGGVWRAPDLTVTNLHAEMYQGQFNIHAGLNVATRALTFDGSSDFDAQRVSPFLTDFGRQWLHQFSWKKPPLVVGGGMVTLPAWTNRNPDWRGEVLPALSLRGEFKAGEGAFRGVPVLSAQSHLTFSNMTWYIPDLVAVRPEGKVELAHVSDEVTKKYYFRVHSTMDVKAVRPLLQTNEQRALDLVEFTGPPLVDAEVWGHWHDVKQIGVRAHVEFGNFTLRGETASHFHADLQYTNQLLNLFDARIERRNQYMMASNVIVDIPRKRIFITNGFSTMEPGPFTRAIGPKVARDIEPYHFFEPPTVQANGFVPIAEGVPADMHFKIEGGPFRWLKFNSGQIAGEVDWVGEHLTVKNIRSSFYGGKLTGGTEVDFSPHEGAKFSFDTIVTDVNLRSLIADMSSRTNQLEGRLSGHLNIYQADTRDPKSWFGRGQVDLRDGLIWEIPIFGIFSPILDGISPGLGKSRASEASGTYEITNSVIRSMDLEIRSPMVRMLYRGTVDFDQRVDAKVEAELLRDTWLVGPVLSTVLSPLTKLFEYKVTGTLGAPKMAPLYVAAKVILMPFHPFRSLKQIFSGESGTNAPPPAPKKEQ